MAWMIASGEYDMVLGSRILGRGALAGGMPLYKYISNRFLTAFENLFLDVKLSGYQDELSTKRYEEFADDLTGKTKTDLPFLGKITAISLDRQNPHLVVSWGEGDETIDYEGLQPIGDAWIKWKSGMWTTFERSNVPEFLKQLHVGDTVLTERNRPCRLLYDKRLSS